MIEIDERDLLVLDDSTHRHTQSFTILDQLEENDLSSMTMKRANMHYSPLLQVGPSPLSPYRIWTMHHSPATSLRKGHLPS